MGGEYHFGQNAAMAFNVWRGKKAASLALSRWHHSRISLKPSLPLSRLFGLAKICRLRSLVICDLPRSNGERNEIPTLVDDHSTTLSLLRLRDHFFGW